MRVGDQVAMVSGMAAVGQFSCKPDAFVVKSIWSDVLGSRMHAVVVGEGAPVVLVHGFGVSGAYMLPLAQALGYSVSAFVPDLPGQGKSTQLRGQVSALQASAREPFSLIALMARDDRPAGVRTLLSTARSVLADRIEDRLPLIEQRTLVVYGDKDSFVGREWAERVAGLLPRGRLRVLSGEPHAVHYTQPELVAGLVRELVIEEGQHASRQLPGRLEHRNVSAMKVRQPDI